MATWSNRAQRDLHLFTPKPAGSHPDTLIQTVGALSGPQAEVKTMPRAGHIPILHDSQPKAPPLVGAGVVQGMELAINSKDSHLAALDRKGKTGAVLRQLVEATDPDPAKIP